MKVDVAELPFEVERDGKRMPVLIRWQVSKVEQPAFARIVREEAEQLVKASSRLEPVRALKRFAKAVEKAGNWTLLDFNVGGVAEVVNG